MNCLSCNTDDTCKWFRCPWDRIHHICNTCYYKFKRNNSEMTIKRPTIGALYKGGKEALSYCPKCNPKQKMEERIYLPDEFGRTVIPSDANLWRQCHRCGLILPIYNLKHEGRLTSELKIQQNPFDTGHTLAIQSNRTGKNRRTKKEEYNWVQDEDLKKDLMEGGQLISYSES